VWAANQLKVTGSPLVWRRIRELTNMRPENYRAYLPYVATYTDVAILEKLHSIIEKDGKRG